MKIKYIFPFFTLSLMLVFTLSACGLFSAVSDQIEEASVPETDITKAEEPKEETKPIKDGEEAKIEQEPKDRQEEDAESDAYSDKIRVYHPLPDQIITSPLIVEGEARGMWFFEADFPVKLLDANGQEIAVHYAEALGEWMTEDFVPFKSEIVFEKPGTVHGFLVLEKDNPADKPEYDDAYIIPVKFE
jgi:hypothetical protein